MINNSNPHEKYNIHIIASEQASVIANKQLTYSLLLSVYDDCWLFLTLLLRQEVSKARMLNGLLVLLRTYDDNYPSSLNTKTF